MAATVKKVWLVVEGIGGEINVGAGNFSGSFDVPYGVEYADSHHLVPVVAEADASALTPPAPGGYNLTIPPFGDVIGSYVLTAKKPRKATMTHWVVVCTYTLPTLVDAVRPPEDSGVEHWAVTVDVRQLPFTETVQRFRTPPTLYRAAADGLSAPVEVEAYGGTFIENSAGDAIDGVTVDRYGEEWIIGFNTAVPNWAGIDEAYGDDGRGTVNSEEFTITINGEPRTFAVGTLLFKGVSHSIKRDDVGTYVRVVYTLWWRKDGWLRRVDNKGYRVVVAGKVLPASISASTPVFLKTTTVRYDVGVAVPGDGGEYLEGELYGESDLGAILIYDMDT